MLAIRPENPTTKLLCRVGTTLSRYSRFKMKRLDSSLPAHSNIFSPRLTLEKGVSKAHRTASKPLLRSPPSTFQCLESVLLHLRERKDKIVIHYY